jgi:hypothetical protein
MCITGTSNREQRVLQNRQGAQRSNFYKTLCSQVVLRCNRKNKFNLENEDAKKIS